MQGSSSVEEGVEVAALAAVAIVVAIVVTAIVVVGVRVVGVVVVVVVGLAGWIKGEQVASLIGLGPWPCPSQASSSGGSSPGLVPLLQKNKKQKKRVRNECYIPTHLLKMRGLMKHLLSRMSQPRQRARLFRSPS